MAFRSIVLVLILCVCSLVSGCGRGPSSVRLSDIAPMTTETLSVLLLGEQNIPATRLAPTDKGLLEKGAYESVILTTDIDAFVSISKGALSRNDLQNLHESVVRELGKQFGKHGFTATGGTFPLTTAPAKTLIATITPQTQEGGTVYDRSKGKAKTLIMIRVTVTEPMSGKVLAQRDYYSGADAGRRDGRPLRFQSL